MNALGTEAYFVSSENSLGSADIFKIDLKSSKSTTPVLIIEGIVSDQNNQPIPGATIEFNDLSNSKSKGEAKADEKGKYQITLPSGIFYGINAKSNNYFPVEENIDLRSVFDQQKIEKNLQLIPIKKGNMIILNNIFFESGSATLKIESNNEISKLAQLLQDQPRIKIKINGHTDNNGSNESNLKLSQDRAQAVMEKLLFIYKIEKTRIQIEGFGELKPIADNDTEKGKEKNRRVEFEIIDE